MKEFSQSCQDMLFSDKCPTEVETSPSLWLSSIISPQGGTAGSCGEVPEIVSDVLRKGGSTAESCGEVPVIVSDMLMKGGVGGSTAGSCGEVPAVVSDVLMKG